MEDTKDAEGLVAVGIEFAQKGDLNMAEEQFMKAIQLDPNSFRGFRCLGKVACERNDLRSAIEYYLIALRLNPKSPDNLADLANAYFHSDDFHNALTYAKVAVETDPNNLWAQQVLVRTMVYEDLPSAYDYLEGLLKSPDFDASDPDARSLLAKLFKLIPYRAAEIIDETDHSHLMPFAWEHSLKLNPDDDSIKSQLLNHVNLCLEFCADDKTWPPSLRKAATQMREGVDWKQATKPFFEECDNLPELHEQHNMKVVLLAAYERFLDLAKGE